MIPSLTVKPLDYRKHKRLYNSLKTDKDLTSKVIFEGDRVEEVYLDKYDESMQRHCRQLDLMKVQIYVQHI